MQIAYFPYIFLGETDHLTVGNVNIWNFGKQGKKLVSDKSLYRHIKRLMNVNYLYNKRIDDIGLLSTENGIFIDFNENTLNDFRATQLLLFISSLSKCNLVSSCSANAGIFIRTAENFDLVFQNFRLEQEGIATSTGYVINISNYIASNLTKVKLTAPRHVNGNSRLSLDTELIANLINLKNNNSAKYNVIISAINLFMESYYNTDSLSPKARILLQSSSFETLYELEHSDDKQRDFIVKAKENVHPKNSKTKDKINSWALKFYDLRSRIIHGSTPSKEDFLYHNQRHFDIATFVFVLSIRNMVSDPSTVQDALIWKECEKCEDVDAHFSFEVEDGSLIRALNRMHNSSTAN